MAKKAKADSHYIIYCPHCQANDFKLDDVKPDEKLKFYSDTPYKALGQLSTKKGGVTPFKLGRTPGKESPNKRVSDFD